MNVELFNIQKPIIVINHSNRINDENTHDHFNKQRERTWKNPVSFYDKITQETRNRRKPHQPNEGHL